MRERVKIISEIKQFDTKFGIILRKILIKTKNCKTYLIMNWSKKVRLRYLATATVIQQNIVSQGVPIKFLSEHALN